ncbi:MAG: peptide deformylase [Balneolaceae bacterium]
MSVLPIVIWDDPVLRKRAEPVSANSEELQALIDDMFETMYNASGVGLAAPQIGKSIRLFVMDAGPVLEEEETDRGPTVLMNPVIVDHSEEEAKMEEGCLSIPDIRDDVSRPVSIRIRFLDRTFQEQEWDLDSWPARIVQHELDHLDGVLFTDHLSAFRRRVHRSRLSKLERGVMDVDYPVSLKGRTEIG